MNLTPLGAQVAQQGLRERRIKGRDLLSNINIDAYIHRGMCYDAVAYTRYLLEDNITPNQLITTFAQGWRRLFRFENGKQWRGGNIPAGIAVGFQRVGDRQFFHAAISIGNMRVRGINGGGLGDGWTNIGDRNLNTLMQPTPGIFTNPAGGEMKVWLSNL